MLCRAQSAGAHDFGAGHHVHVDCLVADSVRRDLPRVICVGAAGAEHHTCDSLRPLIWRAKQRRLPSRISGRSEVQRKMIGPTHDYELVTCRRRRRRAHHSQRNRCRSTHSCIPSAPAPKAPGTSTQTTQAIVPHVRLHDQHNKRAGAEGAGPSPCVDQCERAIATEKREGKTR